MLLLVLCRQLARGNRLVVLADGGGWSAKNEELLKDEVRLGFRFGLSFVFSSCRYVPFLYFFFPYYLFMTNTIDSKEKSSND